MKRPCGQATHWDWVGRFGVLSTGTHGASSVRPTGGVCRYVCALVTGSVWYALVLVMGARICPRWTVGTGLIGMECLVGGYVRAWIARGVIFASVVVGKCSRNAFECSKCSVIRNYIDISSIGRCIGTTSML